MCNHDVGAVFEAATYNLLSTFCFAFCIYMSLDIITLQMAGLVCQVMPLAQ